MGNLKHIQWRFNGVCTALIISLSMVCVSWAQKKPDPNTSLFQYVVRDNYQSQRARSLKDLMFFWYEDNVSETWKPWSPRFDGNNYNEKISTFWFSQCQKKDSYYFPMDEVKNKNGVWVLKDICKPEVLYSWGSQRKIDELKEVASISPWDHEFLPSISDALEEQNIRVLYMGLTPVSTFAYGDTMIRLKVRDDVEFVNVDNAAFKQHWGEDCSDMSQAVKDKTIVYKLHVYGSAGIHDVYAFFEYQACSPRVFESWSHDTQENYDEVIKDYLWIRYAESWTGLPKSYQFIVDGFSLQENNDYRKGQFHQQSPIDGVNWSESHLFKNLKTQVDRINEEKGEIFYQQRLGPNHYTQQKDLWFLNQQKSR